MRLTPLLIAALYGSLLFGAATVKTPIDNDDVRVLDVVLHPHDKTPMHEHKPNRVMIYKSSGTENLEFEGGKKSVVTYRANQAVWSPGGGMHAAEVTTPSPLGIVEIELKKAGAGKKITSPLDPLKVDKKHYSLEFENDQVRVTRVRFGAHEGAPLHEHTLTRIVVYLTDAKVQVTSADGQVSVTTVKAGDIVVGGLAKHSEINMLDHAIEVLVTELKY